uniref:B cell scaffold protein with ankyrin repeats 1 n=2 Tax=Propithecus coquereli TaxID=379532 RepID=A0A2K6G1F5_PROCO
NPGEIFIILRDEVIGDTVEVEFTSNNKRVRTQPALWNKKVWCMKALQFPAGLVNVDVHCDGVIRATTKVKYYAATKVAEHPLGVEGPGASLRQNDVEELDSVLTAIFKHQIPYYEFQSLPAEIHSQKECTHFKELPTLLHCAAKFGLKNLATHLLQCSGATWASKMKNMEGSDPARIAERHGHEELKKIFEDFSIQEIGRNYEQENDYEQDIISFSTYIPSAESPASHHDSGKTLAQSAEGAEENESAGGGREDGSAGDAERSPPEADSGSSEDQYEDLYVFIPGVDAASNSQEPPVSSRPPPPPPRPAAAAFQLEKPHCTSPGTIVEGHMESSQTWCDRGTRQETGDESKGEEEKKDEKEQEEEEDPYTFAEIDDSEYDMILASMSMKKKTGSRSFIINRPPAPTPRPTNMPPKEKTTPYIAQVFQKKTPRRQSDDDKFHVVPKKQDRARMESLTAGQEELILLQEKVKNGKMSVDEALEKFKHWQMGKSGLEMIQQEKLRQLRDCIIGKRPEEENVCDKLTIVHHPSGKEMAHNENMLCNTPFSNKLPARLQAEKEFGFCCRKDH